MAANLQTFVTGNGDQPKTLVVVFLRGGADGLNMIAPVQDDGYYRARPRIGIKAADSIRLDDFFGLNPILGGLEPAWKDGALALVHACGSEDSTRSHFEAQDLMEHGGIVAGGWLGRFLRAKSSGGGGALSAVALGKAVPESLRGAPAATVMQSFSEFTLGKDSDRLAKALGRLYGKVPGELAGAARDSMTAMMPPPTPLLAGRPTL